MAFMLLTELLECPKTYLELINSLSVFKLLNDFTDQLGNQLNGSKFENLMSTIGNFVSLLTKKFNNKAKVDQFEKAELFTKLVLTHFIESRSMQFYYTGLNIIKNLLNRNAKKATDMIVYYEECVCYLNSQHNEVYKNSLLDLM